MTVCRVCVFWNFGDCVNPKVNALVKSGDIEGVFGEDGMSCIYGQERTMIRLESRTIGGDTVFQWRGNDGKDYSPIVHSLGEAQEYPGKKGLRQV